MTAEFVASQFHLVGQSVVPTFDEFAEYTVRFQKQENPVYERFQGFTYLPIEAFKQTVVSTFPTAEAEAIFLSSGTSQGGSRSRHFVRSLDVYRRSVTTHFESVFGRGPFRILAHLPSYAELGDASSLVTMVKYLMETFGTSDSAFFLDTVPDLSRSDEAPVLLFGAAFGLLSLADSGRHTLPGDSLVLETGGMKTHRQAIDRSTLHQRLAKGFGIDIENVTSEYGMCELLSQFYIRTDGLFYPPPWVRFSVFDTGNPTREVGDGEPGALAVFDLANIYSVSAILTEDRAIKIGGGFELLGRLSDADLRGCNFLVEDLIGNN